MSLSPAGYGSYNPILARLDGNLTLTEVVSRARAAGFASVDTATGSVPLAEWQPLPIDARVFWFDSRRSVVHDTSAKPGLNTSAFRLRH